MIFKDKTAIITGAGVGIGFEIARQLALGGASVLLNDINEQAANSAAKEIRNAGGICEIICAILVIGNETLNLQKYTFE